MSARRSVLELSVLLAIGTFAVAPAAAEILMMAEGGAASAESGYAFSHPNLRSVVFISSEARQMAILPPMPVFVAPPPLLWRAPSPFPIYPPASLVLAPNSSARPSNRDVSTYHLQRAHGFGQELFYRDSLLSLGIGTPNPYLYWSAMPTYAPVAPGSSRPSNRDNATYNLERAHRFSMDTYKKP